MCKIEGIKRIITDMDGDILGAEVVRKEDGKKIYVPISTKELEEYFGLDIDRSNVIEPGEYSLKDAKIIIDYCWNNGINPAKIVCLKPEICCRDGIIEGYIKVKEKTKEGEKIKKEYIPPDVLLETETFEKFIRELPENEEYIL